MLGYACRYVKHVHYLHTVEPHLQCTSCDIGIMYVTMMVPLANWQIKHEGYAINVLI